jgi:Reverse transcriptase (RNA-dependent DNA polymerase)
MDHVALQATNDPDTLYYRQVLNEKDMFTTAMEHEIKQHNDNQNWVPVKRSTVPSTSRILPSVWSMRRKRNLTTGEVLKYKERLNVDGSRQLKGVDFEETFAPVVSWSSIRLILPLASINNWCTYQRKTNSTLKYQKGAILITTKTPSCYKYSTTFTGRDKQEKCGLTS